MKSIIPRFLLLTPVLTVFALGSACVTQISSAQDQPTGVSQVSPQPATLPPSISPSSPLAEVVRLSQAGVDQSVIMAYVNGSSRTFNLDSDKIIAVSDLGVPNPVVTAMMQRDQVLQQQFAASQAAQPAQQSQPVQPAPAVEPAPAYEPAPTGTADVVTPPPPVTPVYFDQTLAPYGSWVVVNGYGRCWRPTTVIYDPNWQPYCDRGHWVYTDCGWYWASDYSWGATFHYGRWFRNASFGWCWYPGTVWAPSWVTWRYSDSYCGWAPLPPRTSYQAGVGIVYNGSSVSVGFSFGLGASCFTFVPTQFFCNSHPRNYCVPPTHVTQIYNQTTVINNYNINNRTVINHGIPYQNVARVSHTTIRPVPVRDINNSEVHGRPNYTQGANRPAFNDNSRAPAPSQNQNRYQPAQPKYGDTATQNPQRPAPAVNYQSSGHNQPEQVPPANHSQPFTPPASQQNGLPHNTTRYQTETRSSQAGSANQGHGTPGYASAPSKSQSDNNHNGNQNGSGH